MQSARKNKTLNKWFLRYQWKKSWFVEIGDDMSHKTIAAFLKLKKFIIQKTVINISIFILYS